MEERQQRTGQLTLVAATKRALGREMLPTAAGGVHKIVRRAGGRTEGGQDLGDERPTDRPAESGTLLFGVACLLLAASHPL